MRTVEALRRPANLGSVAVWVIGLLVLGLLLALVVIGHFRIALSVSILGLLVAIAAFRADLGLFASILYLGLLGEIRRLLIFLDGWPSLDPLLMIGAVMAVVFVASTAAKREVKFDTAGSRVLGLLLLVMALQIFNPRQGSLVVGVTGALFYIVPVLWFFAARSILSLDTLKVVLFKVLVPFGLAATLYGFYQTFVGYLPHQIAWYNTAGYTALGPIFALKPLSFFSSSTEHGHFLAVIAVVLVGAGIRRQWWLFVVAAVITVGVFLGGSRGPVVRIVFTVACMWAILSPSRSVWILRGAFGLVLGLGGLYWSSTQVSKIDAGGAVGFYIERQTSAFMNPLDRKESSAQRHGAMFVNGIRNGISNPLGYGLGSTTKAAMKFDGDGHSSEVDISNVFLSTGVVGGILYLAFLVFLARSAIVCWQHDRSILMLCVVGALIVTLGDYLAGRYFLSSVMFVIAGALDRHYSEITRAHNSTRQAVTAVSR